MCILGMYITHTNTVVTRSKINMFVKMLILFYFLNGIQFEDSYYFFSKLRQSVIMTSKYYIYLMFCVCTPNVIKIKMASFSHNRNYT